MKYMKTSFAIFFTVIFLSCSNFYLDKNVLTSQINHSRNPVFTWDKTIEEISKIKEKSSLNLKVNSKKFSPLYIGKDFKNKKLQESLVFINTKNQVAFFNLNSKKELTTLASRNEIISTPVISLKYQKLYYSAQSKKKDGTYQFFLGTVDLKDLTSFEDEIPIVEGVYKLHESQYKIALSHRIKCATALSLNDHTEPAQIAFGCSNPPNAKYPSAKYGGESFVRGALITINLSSSGKVLKEENKAFFPSKISGDKSWSGGDTGIYLAGGAPTILPNGDYLLATGNGGTNIKKENYGCSLVVIDHKTMKVKNSKTPFFHYGEDESIECWFFNIDLTSSSPVWLKHKGKNLISIVSKKGEVVLLSESEGNLMEIGRVEVGSIPSYGSAPIFNMKGNAYIFYSSFYNGGSNLEDSYYDTIISDHCVGYIKKDGKKKMSLFWSGPLLNSKANAIDDSLIGIEVQQKKSELFGSKRDQNRIENFWIKYKKQKVIGAVFEDEEEIRKLGLIPFKLTYKFFDHTIYGEKYRIKNNRDYKNKVIKEDYGFLGTVKGNYCIKRPDMHALYKHTRATKKNVGKVGIATKLFSLKDNKLLNTWSRLDSSKRKFRYTPIVIKVRDGVVGVYLSGKNEKTSINFINMENGDLLSSLFLGDVQHFSSAIIANNKLFIPLVKKGISFIE